MSEVALCGLSSSAKTLFFQLFDRRVHFFTCHSQFALIRDPIDVLTRFVVGENTHLRVCNIT